MRHKSKQLIRWADLDEFGHVNNASYLIFMQEAKGDLTWYSRERAGKKPILYQMVVARAEVDYVAPIHKSGGYVDVEVWVEKIGNSSFVFAYEITFEGAVKAKGKTVQVAVDEVEQKSRPLTDEERAFLTEYLD
ncbi:MAG: hypothetical protein RL301_826 [Actinomycetota bacterium]|jgi:acyl-CoA thioester hydrolase